MVAGNYAFPTITFLSFSQRTLYPTLQQIKGGCKAKKAKMGGAAEWHKNLVQIHDNLI
jgi:hypothetical protein